MDFGSMSAGSELASQGLTLLQDLYSQHLRDKMLKPSVKKYLNTLGKNAGYSGYSSAQTDSMKRARDLARGNIARAQGEAMATNMSMGQRASMLTQAGANANDTDFYKLNTSLQNAENKGRESQVDVAEGNWDRANDAFNKMVNDTKRTAGDALKSPAAQESLGTLADSVGDSYNQVKSAGSNALNNVQNFDLYKKFTGRQ